MCSRRSNHPAAADWVPDNQSERCLSCDREFSAFYRRHHCRACGKLVCANCSSRSDFLPQFGYSLRQPVRICDACSSKDVRNYSIFLEHGILHVGQCLHILTSSFVFLFSIEVRHRARKGDVHFVQEGKV